MKHTRQKLFLFFIIAATLSASFFVLVQAEEQDLGKTCQALLEETGEGCKNLSTKDCQALLNKCLAFYQEQSNFYEDKIQATQQEKKTLQNTISLLKNKIQKLNNEIYQSNLMISDLNLQIGDTQTSIDATSARIEDSKIKLAEILRLVQEQDKRSLVEVMLAEDQLSNFFDELASLEALSLKNQELLAQIKALKSQLEGEQQSLTQEKDDLENVVVARTIQKTQNDQLKAEQESLLQKTKGQESLYQQYLKDTQKKSEEIRKRIFQLAQVSEGEAPSYEEAYALAKYVETVTGVRAPLLLGLLEVESAIGRNVGQCNCSSRPDCKYADVGWKDVMPKSNWDAFLTITKDLGLDADTTPVSCAINGGKVQWGGAMGPAQFMPNTWLNLGYKEKVENVTGSAGNPWRIKDAFLAAGFYLKDWGADTQVLKKEIGAVTAYLCGSSAMTSTCKKAGGEGYRLTVMQKAAEWQQWIEEGVF